jgi:glycosyltransferase involved in cell wall biosynthesis
MKIAMLCPEDVENSPVGGISSYTQDVAFLLSEYGHEVWVISPLLSGGLTTQSYCKKRVRFVSIPILIQSSYSLWTLSFRLKWMWQTYQFCKNQHFDVIESPEAGASSLLLSLGGYPVIVRLHRSRWQFICDNFYKPTIGDWGSRFVELLTVIFAQVITSPTDYILSSYRWLWNILPHKKRFVFWNPSLEKCFKRENIQLPSDVFEILFVGRVEFAKGVDVLVRALGLLFERRMKSKVHMTIVGWPIEIVSEEQSRYLQKLFQTIVVLKLTQHITIIPFEERKKLDAYYRQASLLVVPSRGSENQPTVISEALRYRLPILMSDAGGMKSFKRVIGKQWIFPEEDIQLLADRLSFFIANKLRMRSLWEPMISKVALVLDKKKYYHEYKNVVKVFHLAI